MATDADIIIVGGGLAGLCCARTLHAAGRSFLLLEAADAVGGRVRTDTVDGFRLDRGFQVLLTAYPEARQVLDYAALDLRPFYPGALVRLGGRFHRVADPWRRPWGAVRAVTNPVGSVRDKLRIGRLRRRALRGSLDALWTRPASRTLDALRAAGFSDTIITRFFGPFLGGVFLDPDLQTSSRMLDFVFRMFASGDIAVPAHGMGAIPLQLVAPLPPDSIRRAAPVRSVEPGQVVLHSGEVIPARTIVVATAGPLATQVLGRPLPHAWRSVTCVYFAAPQPPTTEAVLVLNGEGQGLINNLTVLSAVAPSYAPTGSSLVSVTVLGHSALPAAQLQDDLRRELADWYGAGVAEWRHLRTYRIAEALPDYGEPGALPGGDYLDQGNGIYLCGDAWATPSIQGAMVSGRRVAEAILAASP